MDARILNNSIKDVYKRQDTDSEIVFGLENRGIPREALRSRLDELTEELHLSELRGRNIFELSGGEKQKICLLYTSRCV